MMQNKLIHIILIVLSLLLTWQIIVALFALPPYILPSPLTVFASLYEQRSILFTHAKPTLIETLLGFILGLSLGVVAALFVGYYRRLSPWLLSLILISQAVPTFAIAPILVVWFGYGLSTKILTCTLMIFFPVTSAFYDGLQKTQPERLALAKTMNATKWRTFLYIRVPAALPSLASGIRIASVAAPLGAVIGEWVGSSQGLGYLMLNANARMQIDMMYAALIVIVVMALGLYFIVDVVLRRLIWWAN